MSFHSCGNLETYDGHGICEATLLLNFFLSQKNDQQKQGNDQGWIFDYLALGCQFQFWCVETQMAGFNFGSVSRLLKNRFQFRLRTASVSGFQFRLKFHPRKLFYFE